MADLRNAILQEPGVTSTNVRRAAFAGEGVQEVWAVYVGKVREMSYRIGDGDVEVLRAAGESEDAILEITLAAAAGAAQRRLDVGLRALAGLS